MHFRIVTLATWLLVVLLMSAAKAAENRHALIIGNGIYQHAHALPNPPNDATDFADKLRSGGWSVTLVKDAGVKCMVRAVREFCETARGADAGFFFYAGHGIEVKGQNYLLPVDASLAESDGEDALPLETLALDRVLGDLGAAGIRLKVVVLDCCRDNPLQRSWIRSRSAGGGGLAAVDEKKMTEGTMLVFSTAPGQTAADGDGRNSPFTSALLQRLSAGSGGVSDVFGDVAKTLSGRQAAWIRFDGSGASFAAFRDLVLLPSATGQSAATPSVPPSNQEQSAPVLQKAKNVCRQVMMGLKIYAADHNGKYPAELIELIEQGVLEVDGAVKTDLSALATLKSQGRSDAITQRYVLKSVLACPGAAPAKWLYRKGMTDTSPNEPVLASPFPISGQRVLVFNSGEVMEVSEDLFQEKGAELFPRQ